MKMKFSVIIPVYNAEKYIERAIDSIVKQDYKDYEMILINDGSTDRSLEIIQRLAERNTRIRVESIVNEGVSHARNKGIELANGEYVLFMDADDMHEENTLQQIEDFLVKYDYPHLSLLLIYFSQDKTLNKSMLLLIVRSHFALKKKTKYRQLCNSKKNIVSILCDTCLFLHSAFP